MSKSNSDLFTLQGVIIPDQDHYQTVDVQIQGELITAIAPHLDPIGSLIDGHNKLLLPGFINAHTHSSEMWQRGMVPPYPLELWLAHLHEFAPLDPKKVYLSALGTAVETLLSGGTSVVDHLSLIPHQEMECIAAAVAAYQEVGIRAFIAPLLQDEVLASGIPRGGQDIPYPPYHLSTNKILDLMQEVVQRYHHPEAGISIMVAPTGIQLCSDALFRGLSALSDQYDLCRHSHLLETRAQAKLATEKYGCSAVEHLQTINFLDYRTSLAHGVWLTDRDIQILAETQSTVVHNPLSNLRLGSGIAPILKYRQAGVNVSFGCDGSASNDSQDLLEAIKIGSILHSITDPDYRHWITPRQAVEMATLGGARGLNRHQHLGSLDIGKQADLVLYDLTQLSLLPRTDPIGLLILGRPTQVVDKVWVRGKLVVSDKQVLGVNTPLLSQQLFEQSQWNPQPLSPAVAQTEARYRAVMGLMDLKE
jgi:cytosine/adenosine deaminase-related metal-dependent hydrolase